MNWHLGNIMEIDRECYTIQKLLKNTSPTNSTETVSRKFESLMKKGIVTGAVKLLTSNVDGGILPVNEKTMLFLQSKRPEPQEYNLDAINDEQLQCMVMVLIIK